MSGNRTRTVTLEVKHVGAISPPPTPPPPKKKSPFGSLKPKKNTLKKGHAHIYIYILVAAKGMW